MLKNLFLLEMINLETLVDIKSKEELIGEIVGLLQSPAKNVISALTSSKSKIAGLVKPYQKKNNNY